MDVIMQARLLLHYRAYGMHGVKLSSKLSKVFKHLNDNGFLKWDDGRVTITNSGIVYLDTLCETLLEQGFLTIAILKYYRWRDR